MRQPLKSVLKFENVGNSTNNAYCPYDELAHAAGLGEEDFGVLELDVTVVA